MRAGCAWTGTNENRTRLAVATRIGDPVAGKRRMQPRGLAVRAADRSGTPREEEPKTHRSTSGAYKYRQRIARLSGKRRSGRGEPLDLELIVLFLSVSLILVIPWILHDVRFVMLVPLAFLVVPGLFGVLLKATSEFIAILAEARRKERRRRREAEARGVDVRRGGRGGRGGRVRLSRVNVVGFLKGFVAFWRGFL